MSGYRDDAAEALRDARWTFFKGAPLFIMIIVFLVVFTFILNSLGLIGQKVVERKVFENSIQYAEARKTEAATFEAQLAEINRKLSGSVDPETRTNLEAQAAALRIQLKVARARSK